MTPYQILFIDYVQQCLNAGAGYTKDGAITWAATKLMAPMKTWPVTDFSKATTPSAGLDADWDDLVKNNLLPTVAQPQFLPNNILSTDWVKNQTGKNI